MSADAQQPEARKEACRALAARQVWRETEWERLCAAPAAAPKAAAPAVSVAQPSPTPPAVPAPPAAATVGVTTSAATEARAPAPIPVREPGQPTGTAQSAPTEPTRETAAPTQAAVLRPADFSFAMGSRVWVSSGFTNWNFSGAGINVLSELRWRGLDAVIPEVNAELVFKRLVLLGSLGGGGIDDGVLIDDDFALPNRRGRFSHTRSRVDDEGLFYVNVDVGFRLLSYSMAGNPLLGYLDLLLGYQHWHEKYVAFGATGFAAVSSEVKALTHDYTWQSLRVGFRYYVPGPWGLGVKGRVLFNPWTYSEMDDIHHLRTDLKQDPSFRSTATGGFGTQLDVGFAYNPWPWLTLETGFEYWRIDSGSGDKFTYTLSSGTQRDKLNELTIERYGPYFQLQVRF